MKKFYTLLAAAAVTMSAAAAPTLATTAAPAMAKKMARTFEPKTFDASMLPALNLQKPVVAEGEYESLEPQVYGYSYYSYAGKGTYTGICEFSVYNEETNAVMLRSFMDPSFMLVKGEADEANGTVSFPAQYLTQMYDRSDNVYDMWLYAAEFSADQKEVILLPDDPIVFQAKEDGSIVGLNQLLVICAEGNVEMAYDFAMEVAMEETADWAKLSYKTCLTDDEGNFIDDTESLITLHNASLADGVLTLSDAYTFGVDLPVAIDYAAGKATINVQSLAQLDDEGNYFLAIAGINGEDVMPISGTLESPNTIVWDCDWTFGLSYGQTIYLWEYNLGGKIVTGFRLDGSGVKDVAVDANAPVEYYNLQGVRVAEPTNGIYIRRQGNTASKVLVVR